MQVQLRKNTEKYMTELSKNEEKIANFLSIRVSLMKQLDCLVCFLEE